MAVNDYVVAESMVRKLHADYVDAVFRKDIDAFGDCFSKNCEWRIAGQVLRGRGEIVGFMRQVFDMFNRILLTPRPSSLELGSGGTASARTYFTENSQMVDGTPVFAIGSYYERFVDEGDRWRFAWRVFRTEYAGSPDLTGSFHDNPDYGPPPAMPPADTIPADFFGNLSAIEVAPEEVLGG